jgi:hypothetical protein
MADRIRPPLAARSSDAGLSQIPRGFDRVDFHNFGPRADKRLRSRRRIRLDSSLAAADFIDARSGFVLGLQNKAFRERVGIGSRVSAARLRAF